MGIPQIYPGHTPGLEVDSLECSAVRGACFSARCIHPNNSKATAARCSISHPPPTPAHSTLDVRYILYSMRIVFRVFGVLVLVAAVAVVAAAYSATTHPLPAYAFDHVGGGLAVVNATLYVVGGSDSDHVEALQYGGVSELRDSNLAWRPVSSLRFARSNLSVVQTSSGLVIAIGGSFAGEALSVVEIYRPDVDQWRTASPLPQARYAASAVVLPNDRVLVTGGFDSAGQPSASVFEYDASTDLWTENTPLPEAKADHNAVVVEGLVFVLCGSNNDAGFAASVESSGRLAWRAGPAFPYPHYASAVATVETEIYLFGGISFGFEGTSILMADLQQERPLWSSLLPPLPGPASHTSAVSDGTVIFHVGGLAESNLNFYMATTGAIPRFD